MVLASSPERMQTNDQSLNRPTKQPETGGRPQLPTGVVAGPLGQHRPDGVSSDDDVRRLLVAGAAGRHRLRVPAQRLPPGLPHLGLPQVDLRLLLDANGPSFVSCPFRFHLLHPQKLD